ncbi:prevent-host-death family protein [Syntrophobotulus glycolicus DSM 8271]|uniref:Antitoxin n=1 Tax=Syntrophobotulus glycolicus (strain DSM 8271 / FlGlyR) TaxID=645991 RepID=F0SW68_SYNGF|nr:type II toxin-antitoxin system Phd/YefM family antitoxin [Syntrophobotulus glycolicus]ADY54554.1 prevent-host-death family protein [Syntrophobotulus glycolicus DSM 8271]
MDLRKLFDHMISVSELGRGQASKIIQSVEDTGNPYIVVKNNKPQAVIISIEEYSKLLKSKDSLDSLHAPLFSAPVFTGDDHSGILSDDEINIFLSKEEND